MQYVNINDIFSKGTSCEGEEKKGSQIEILGRFQIQCLWTMSLWSKPHSISDNFAIQIYWDEMGGGLLLLKSPIPIPKKRGVRK